MAKVCKLQMLLLEATEQELKKIETVNESLHGVKEITKESIKEIKGNRPFTKAIAIKGQEIIEEISDDIVSGRFKKSIKEGGEELVENIKKIWKKTTDFLS